MLVEQQSVIIADSHAIYRQTVKEIIVDNSYFNVISEAESSESLITQIEYFKPDVVILDMVLPGKDCFTILSDYNHTYPAIKFIIISSFDDHAYSERAQELGAIAYLKKDNLTQSLKVTLHNLTTSPVTSKIINE
jgi:two-component system response regulator DegU